MATVWGYGTDGRPSPRYSVLGTRYPEAGLTELPTTRSLIAQTGPQILRGRRRVASFVRRQSPQSTGPTNAEGPSSGDESMAGAFAGSKPVTRSTRSHTECSARPNLGVGGSIQWRCLEIPRALIGRPPNHSAIGVRGNGQMGPRSARPAARIAGCRVPSRRSSRRSSRRGSLEPLDGSRGGARAGRVTR